MAPLKRRAKKLPKWLREQSAAMVKVDKASDTDVVIPVMGATGVGKSTFINTASSALGGPEQPMKVGHSLQSCTSTIQHVAVPHPYDRNRRIIFVDTPGFDDTFVDDAEILRLISVWMARSYHEGMKLAGIIYMHEISQARMFGTARKNLTMFKKLCGDEALYRVFLTTTKWEEIPADVGVRREQQLRQSYWKEMIAQKSTLCQLRNEEESARGLVKQILQKDEPDDFLVQISNELVELKKFIPETEAGQTLRYTLAELLEQQKQMAQRLKEDDGSEGAKEKLNEIQSGMRATLHQIMKLKVPLSQKIMSFFGL